MTTRKSTHEGLKKLQRELARPFVDSKPSEVFDVYWIHAKRAKGRYPAATARSGKWLVFVGADEVNEVWARIKKATEDGRLGDSAKVATSRPNPNATNPQGKVICVYTYDWQDREDVMRVRNELRRLGIEKKIPYKADKDTLVGKCRVAGNTRISKYYE